MFIIKSLKNFKLYPFNAVYKNSINTLETPIDRYTKLDNLTMNQNTHTKQYHLEYDHFCSLIFTSSFPFTDISR